MNNSISTTTGKTKIKIVLLGNQSVGKSSIIQKYVNNKFQQSSNPTVGIDFLAKNTNYKSKNYRLQLWDTAGQQRFRSMIPSYLKDAQCALLVYDVASGPSLDSIEMWLKLYNDNKLGQGFAFLVGNKIDLEQRQITTQEGIQKSRDLGLPYFEISAKNGENINNLFNSVIDGFSEISNEISKIGMNFESKKKITPQKMIKQQSKEKEQQSEIKDKTASKLQQQSPPKKEQQRTILIKTQDIQNPKKKKTCC